ncbi:unnamed protein product [Merluccius merluccius]
MKVRHLNTSALVVRWARPEVTYHPPILHFLVSYSWTAHDDSYEETHLTDAKHKLEAVISPVSPDVLYLFRVQSVCTNDMRSDFSQSMLFRANTTRIFEGTRIVKTGMPTVSPASSADMAPISSGSSTWTSSGLPFSFVSMATGIGPSSSGSQATVASVVTSTLLAGLGFSGGVISSFPSSVWPTRAPAAPAGGTARGQASPTTATSASGSTPRTYSEAPSTQDPAAGGSATANAKTKDNSDGAEDGEKGGGEVRGEREGEEKEEEEEEEEEGEKEQKKEKKGRADDVDDLVGGGRGAAVKEPPSATPASTAKEKDREAGESGGSHGSFNATAPPPVVEDQAVFTSAEVPTTIITTAPNSDAGTETMDFSLPDDSPLATQVPISGRNRSHWPFSIHTAKSVYQESRELGAGPAALGFFIQKGVVVFWLCEQSEWYVIMPSQPSAQQHKWICPSRAVSGQRD